MFTTGRLVLNLVFMLLLSSVEKNLSEFMILFINTSRNSSLDNLFYREFLKSVKALFIPISTK